MELITEYMATRIFDHTRYVFIYNDIVKVNNKFYRFVKEDCGLYVCSPLNIKNLEYIYFSKDNLVLVPKILYTKYNIKQ